MIATYHNSTATGTSGTWAEYYGTSDTGTGGSQDNFCIGYYDSPKIYAFIKKPNNYPAIPWEIKPTKNITTKTAHRIKQPVSRSGFYRGQRRNICNVHAIVK